MKGQAVPLYEQHQRKEARRKEITQMYLERRNIDKGDQEKPRITGAVIYLFKPEPAATKRGHDIGVPSLAAQRKLCRYETKRLGATVIGEFVDFVGPHSSARPGFRRALDAARRQRLDYLIVITMDTVHIGTVDAFEVAVRPGNAGTESTLQNGGD